MLREAFGKHLDPLGWTQDDDRLEQGIDLHWASRVDLDTDVALFKANNTFCMWANYAIFLCARVLALLAPLASANPGGLFFEGGQGRSHSHNRPRYVWTF